jgi:hypothetical protein
MASNSSSDNLMSALRASGVGQSGSVADQLTSMTTQLEQLRATNETLAQLTAAQQTAVLAAQSSSADASGGGGTVLDTIASVWGGGLGMSPLISGLVGLFGGGDSSSGPAPVTPYVRPLPIQLDAGFSDAGGGAPFGVGAAQGGAPRAVTNAAPAQITVQVNAMDSQSFLDHSQDIAMAVRQAMLETTVLNDVIREV